jgi:hydroxymethylbilane synthase
MTLRIGSRGSQLALTQSRMMAAEIGKVTGEEPEIVIVKTTGDADQTSRLASFGGAGAFTMEIDVRQRAGDFEISVHSLKDLPTQGREGLLLTAVPPRAPIEDCLVSRSGATLADLPAGAVVGTGSERRRAQLRRLRPDVEVTGMRGNVDTRIRKVREGDVDATFLARAGLVRLGLTEHITEVLDAGTFVPAAAQGALAVVVREGADEALAAVAQLDHGPTHAEITAERAVLGKLGGGCHLPMGVLARADGDRLTLHARVVSPDGTRMVEERGEGALSDAMALGADVGDRLVANGARELLPS